MKGVCVWGVCVCVCMCVLVTQSCSTLCNSIDCSPPGSSAHAIFPARILEWVVFPSPGDLLDPWIKPESPASPVSQADSLPLKHQESPHMVYSVLKSYAVKLHPFAHIVEGLWGQCLSMFLCF